MPPLRLYQVILNPSPARHLPDDIYQHISVLILNETEARQLLSDDSSPDQEINSEFLHDITDRLLDLGVEVTILTLGERGVFCKTEEEKGQRSGGILLPGRKTQVVDTTGAGDAFVGAFAARLSARDNRQQWRDGKQLSASVVQSVLPFCVYASSLAVEKRGAQGLPWLNEVLTTLDKDKAGNQNG